MQFSAPSMSVSAYFKMGALVAATVKGVFEGGTQSFPLHRSSRGEEPEESGGLLFIWTRSLFQFHEEQNEDCPHANGYRKLNQLCVSQGTSSWKGKCKSQHGQCCEYPESQFGFRVHGLFSSLFACPSRTRCSTLAASSSQNRERASLPVPMALACCATTLVTSTFAPPR